MTLLAHPELVAAVAGYETPVEPGRIVPVLDGDPVERIVAALSIRSRGGIPLVGDDRWSAEYCESVRRLADEAGTHPEQAWATLTSGSTGTPRILLRTAESWAASFGAIADLLELTDADAIYLPSPAASSLSLFSVAHAFAAGVSLVVPLGHTVTAADLAESTVFHGTPTSLRAVVEAGGGPRLRVALVGGADLDSALRERAESLGIRVVAYYGAAELSFVAVDAGDGLRAFPRVDLALRDGELWASSPYFASRALSARGALRSDDTGWATVGDRADLVNGRLTLRGRSDDAILTAAATVIPAEVEAALRRIDGVGDAVVFGFPAPGVGALVSAVLEPDGAHPLPAAAVLRDLVTTGLASAYVPRRWFTVAELPRTVTGKPARAEIVRSVLAGEVARLG
ncbi:AMP-binding protein [Leifsonia poae]|uniref:AMP-binding protein n=1 Tax=Leifsonia poae TaxID=110933 RepID=UPI003D67B06E